VTRPRYLYALKNAEMQGSLENYLREAKATRKSYASIVKELSSVGTIVGKTTVFEWIKDLPKQTN